VIAYSKILPLIICVSFFLPVFPVFSEENTKVTISEIHYQEKKISELSEIPLSAVQSGPHDKKLTHKVDELIDLLEAHKKSAEQGTDIDLLQEKVKEVNRLLEEQKAGPPQITLKEFHTSLCFSCHDINDFSPSDKTRKQWRRLIEEDGHAIFENISWETPFQKHQVLQFLIENAGNYRSEGIGVWE